MVTNYFVALQTEGVKPKSAGVLGPSYKDIISVGLIMKLFVKVYHVGP